MNLTNEQWKILPLEGEDYFRVRGTQLGHRYKIANVPFPVYDGNERDVDEALKISKLIVAAPKLFGALVSAMHGLMWYQDMHPEDHSSADDEMLTKIAEALEGL